MMRQKEKKEHHIEESLHIHHSKRICNIDITLQWNGHFLSKDSSGESLF